MQWGPVALRSSRLAIPAALAARGCRCQGTACRFPEWVLRGCPLGVLRMWGGASMTPESLTAVLRHDAVFQLRSRARALPVNRSSIFRGYISEDDPDVRRGASGLEDSDAAAHASNWYATLKHHLAFIIRTDDLKRGDNHEAPRAAAKTCGIKVPCCSLRRRHATAAVNGGSAWRRIPQSLETLC